MKPLKAYSNAPLTLIDIGARAGIHPRWRKLMNHFPVQIIGFEPDEAECAALNAKGEAFVKYLPFAVGEKVESQEPFISWSPKEAVHCSAQTTRSSADLHQNAITPSNAKFQFKLTRSMPFLNSQALTMWII
jgi:hypothetical protein